MPSSQNASSSASQHKSAQASVVEAEHQQIHYGLLTQLYFFLAIKLLNSNTDVASISTLPRRGCARLLRWAAQGGHLQAKRMLGVLLCRHGASRLDKRQGVEYLQQAAKGHDTEAQYYLGHLYREDVDYLKKDERMCLKWISLAAEAGHSQAQEELAKAYDKGELGLTPNPRKAEALHRAHA